MTTRQSGFAAPLLTATLIIGGGLSVASKGAMAAPVPSLSYLGIVKLMATPGAMASPFPTCPVGQGCTQSFDSTNSTETYDFNPTPTGTSFTQPSTTLNITSPLVSGGPVGNTFGGTAQFGTHPFSTFSSSTANGPSSFALGDGMSAGSGQSFAFTDFITPQPTTAHPNGTPITVNISAQLSQLMSGFGGFNPTPANCAGIGGTILNSAANITLTMSGGVFLQSALCNNIPTQSAHGTIAAIVGTPFELDGQLVLNTNGEIGAALPFGASSSIDETHTTTISLSGPVPLTSASGASYAGPIPEPGTLALLGSGVLGLAGMIRRKLSV